MSGLDRPRSVGPADESGRAVDRGRPPGTPPEQPAGMSRERVSAAAALLRAKREAGGQSRHSVEGDASAPMLDRASRAVVEQDKRPVVDEYLDLEAAGSLETDTDVPRLPPGAPLPHGASASIDDKPRPAVESADRGDSGNAPVDRDPDGPDVTDVDTAALANLAELSDRGEQIEPTDEPESVEATEPTDTDPVKERKIITISFDAGLLESLSPEQRAAIDSARVPDHDEPAWQDNPDRPHWRTIAEEIGEVRSFPSFEAAKRELGGVRGTEIHHIVEQSQALEHRSGFSMERINTTDNLTRLPEAIHRSISGYFSSKPFGSEERVRDALNGRSWEEQYKFGQETLDDLWREQ